MPNFPNLLSPAAPTYHPQSVFSPDATHDHFPIGDETQIDAEIEMILHGEGAGKAKQSSSTSPFATFREKMATLKEDIDSLPDGGLKTDLQKAHGELKDSVQQLRTSILMLKRGDRSPHYSDLVAVLHKHADLQDQFKALAETVEKHANEQKPDVKKIVAKVLLGIAWAAGCVASAIFLGPMAPAGWAGVTAATAFTASLLGLGPMLSAFNDFRAPSGDHSRFQNDEFVGFRNEVCNSLSALVKKTLTAEEFTKAIRSSEAAESSSSAARNATSLAEFINLVATVNMSDDERVQLIRDLKYSLLDDERSRLAETIQKSILPRSAATAMLKELNSCARSGNVDAIDVSSPGSPSPHLRHSAVTLTFNLDVVPTKDLTLSKAKSVSFGDMHGNAELLLAHLISSGHVSCDQKNWQKMSDAFNRGDFKEFQKALQNISFDGNSPSLTLLGDLLADRVGNDLFMLAVLDRLIDAKPDLKIIFSNHDSDFVRYYLQNRGKQREEYSVAGCGHFFNAPPPGTVISRQNNGTDSLNALHNSIVGDPSGATRRQFEKMAARYIERLQLFDISEDNKVFVCHGRVNKPIFDQIARDAHVPEDTSDPKAKISHINRWFQSLCQSNFETYNNAIPTFEARHPSVTNLPPIYAAIWRTWDGNGALASSSQQSGDTAPMDGIRSVLHGHCKESRDSDQMVTDYGVSLDGEFGKRPKFFNGNLDADSRTGQRRAYRTS